MSGREMSGRRMSYISQKKMMQCNFGGKFKFLGTQMVQTLPMGLAPPVYIWAEVRPSGRHQEAKTKP